MPYMATCEHFQVVAATLQIQLSPPRIARVVLFSFLGTIPNTPFMLGKGDPFIGEIKSQGKGRQRKGGRGRQAID